MPEMETMDLDVGQNSAGATTPVVDLVKACEKVQLNVVWTGPYISTVHKEF